MISLNFIRQEDYFVPWLFLAPIILLAAHVMAGLALLIFGRHVREYPLNPVGLGFYLIAIIISVILFAVGLKHVKSDRATPKHVLMLLSLPALAGLIFSAALWLTPWLGNAPYAPWKAGDDDIVVFLSLFFTMLWTVIAILYGSYAYLLTGGTIQLLVYFGAHALPHWLRFPEANPMGVQPGFPILLSGLFILGGLLITLRNRLADGRQPSLWIAALLLTTAGSWTFYLTLNSFPVNDMILGWTASVSNPARQVPPQAWNWTRSAAQSLALLAAAAVPVTGVASWFMSKATGMSRKTSA
jgi:hypothetical protein